MRQEPYYFQKPVFSVVGLTLKLGAWQFRCRAIDPSDPLCIKVDLPPTEISFKQDVNFSKMVTLYVTPMFDGKDNYYLDEVLGDGIHISNPLTEKWTPDISVVPCLNIIVQKAGDGAALTVTANEFEFPLPVPPPPVPPPPSPEPPPDPRRDVVHAGLRVKAWRKGKQPEGWELLDAHKHKKAFPISLGRLKRGENWYVEVPV